MSADTFEKVSLDEPLDEPLDELSLGVLSLGVLYIYILS